VKLIFRQADEGADGVAEAIARKARKTGKVRIFIANR